MKKGILFTNMMSMDMKTCLYQLRIVGGTPLMHPATGTLGQFTILPLSAPRFGPKMCSATMMSTHPMG
jgi:hypothetical protein